MTYPVMAEDVREFMDTVGIREAYVLGHSMGGKVAMVLALRYPERVARLVVVDIAPKAYPPGHLPIIQALKRLDLKRISSRQEADQWLAREIPDAMVRQFLLKYLVRDPAGGFRWQFNLEAIEKNYDKIAGWPPIEGQYSKPTLFIRGGRSSYIQPEDISIIRKYFPRAEIVTIPGAGHWVHAEAPEAFLAQVQSFLLK